ncbi:hypothetical protein [Sediminicoccus sp. BL-A-41-H5]|jgi:hypothetical protein|uniref:hypothetical protein n=1 Tax=Sediminicoccus sp. BL-A-41-H5 TaxID=3421106 RepID=UPI003D66B669
MPISSGFFIALYLVFALVGLFGAARAEGYLYTFSLLLLAFGLWMAFSVVKRHYDAKHSH